MTININQKIGQKEKRNKDIGKKETKRKKNTKTKEKARKKGQERVKMNYDCETSPFSQTSHYWFSKPHIFEIKNTSTM